MATIRFNRKGLPAQPWKNGGGVTREVMCLPLGSDMSSFDWRVSIAHIASSGPFSLFEGVDRVITLLEGAGVQLRSPHAGIDHRLDTPLQPFAFPGEAAVHAQLLGACDDFNVMTRRNTCTASVQVLRQAATLPASSQGLLLAVRGSWHDDAGPLQPLETDDGLWWHDAPTSWRLRPQGPDAALLAVLITPA